MLRQIIVAVVAMCTATACSTVDAKDVRTSGLEAGIAVTVPEDASKAIVWTTFRVGNLTFVELGDDETVTASGGGESVALRREKRFGATGYYGELEGVTTPGTEIVVALRRDKDNTSAPKSVVRLPEPVKLTAPANGAKVSRQQALVVRLDKASDQPAELSWGGGCVTSTSVKVPAGQTEVTIRASSFQYVKQTPAPNGYPEGQCAVKLQLVRTLTGQADPAFKGGGVTTRSESIRTVVSVP